MSENSHSHIPLFMNLVDTLVALSSAKSAFENELRSDGVSVDDALEDAALFLSGSWQVPIERARFLAHHCARHVGIVTQVPRRPRDDA